MLTRQRLILLAGVVLLVAGVIGLFVPVSVSGSGNSSGGSVACGNAARSDLSAARSQDNQNVGNSPVVQSIPVINQVAPQSHYVADCNSALGNRRLWTIPLTLIGIAVIAAALFRQRQRGASATGI
ncbi:MAG: hypothetical protein QOC63_195 [Mycobacterium sp.]|nr:hypothetical protein [Mycobacterium sp.]